MTRSEYIEKLKALGIGPDRYSLDGHRSVGDGPALDIGPWGIKVREFDRDMEFEESFENESTAWEYMYRALVPFQK
jgi:hypothetical protein